MMNTVDLTKLKDGEILHFKCGGSAIVSHVAMFHGQFHIDIEGFCSQVFNKYGELCVDGGYFPNSIFSIARISRVGDFPFEQAPIITSDDEYEKHMKATMNQGMYGGKDHREAQRQVNMMYSDLANMVASKSKEELREIGRKAAHQGYIDGLFWYWVIRFALFCSACIFAFILYMHIFKL